MDSQQDAPGISPLLVVLGPRDRLGWALRYLVLALGVAGTVLAHDVISDQHFHGDWARYLGHWVMIGLPLYALATWVMADLGRVQAALRAAAETDPLTGCLRRPAFIAAVERRLSQTGVMLMFDIDRLARINSRHDHHAGDLCLIALGMHLRAVLRQSDLVGRVNGPTMAAFIPGASHEAGLQMAARIAEGLQIATGGVRVNVTVSVGVTLADGETGLAALMGAAEEALLRAKARGPAQVMMAAHRLAA